MRYFGKECPACGDELGANPSECNECGDWLEAQLATVDRQARTIRRLRALADGYRARAERNGQAAQAKCGTCHEQGAAERARIVARLRELASELRAEAETHGDTVFGTVAAVQEKTIEGLVSIIEKSEEP